MSEHRIEVDVASQRLRLYRSTELLVEYAVSTALKGVGDTAYSTSSLVLV